MVSLVTLLAIIAAAHAANPFETSRTSRVGRCDPAGSWLAYAVSKGNGKAVTQVNVTWDVPANPAAGESPSAPGWWYGVEPTPACDLIQPILAYGYTGDEYSIFNGEFNWNGGGWWASGTQTVQPGDTIYSTLTLTEGGKKMRMVIGKVNGPAPIVSVRDLTASTPYTDLYFVVEHQPEKCSEYPANGKITFSNIYVELDGKPATPQWEQVKYEDACNCKGVNDPPPPP
eukprot:Sspe_Gene.31513::Locus_15538_Transcript_1_1_Confidence_1.000_Length_737::g.31513::m.31513